MTNQNSVVTAQLSANVIQTSAQKLRFTPIDEITRLFFQTFLQWISSMTTYFCKFSVSFCLCLCDLFVDDVTFEQAVCIFLCL